MPSTEAVPEGSGAGAANSRKKASAAPRRFTNVQRFDRIDSTNAFCVKAAGRGEPEGLVVVADEQSAGRGRRDRRWVAPKGSSLLCSVLFRPAIALPRIHLIPMVVGLSAIDAIQRCGATARLKWPNDVLIGERKVAGILTERVEAPEQGAPVSGADVSFPALVVGIGINCSWPGNWPEQADEELRAALADATTIAAEAGVAPSPIVVFDELVCAIERRYADLLDGGDEAVLTSYRALCSTIGSTVRVDTAHESYLALAVDVADDGRLVLQRSGGIEMVDSADVIHLRPADTDHA